MPDKQTKKIICFLGAGNMAEAIISGLLDTGAARAANIIAADIRVDRLRYLKSKYSVRTGTDNIKSAEKADIIFLAVKPQHFDGLLGQMKGRIKKNQLVISIAAGITTRFIEKYLGKVPVIRIMPNTPALVKEGMFVITRGRFAAKKDERAVSGLLSPFGEVVVQPERIFNAVTAVSGSGPAYIFYFAESMIKAARKMGFDGKNAAKLVKQTIAGAGRMLKLSQDTAEILRKKVTSPGGTTEQAIKHFEKAGLEKIIYKAVDRARKRAFELTK